MGVDYLGFSTARGRARAHRALTWVCFPQVCEEEIRGAVFPEQRAGAGGPGVQDLPDDGPRPEAHQEDDQAGG